MAQVLLVYSTIDGHTREICERLGSVMGDAGHQVVLEKLTASSDIDVTACDALVIGASIRYGKHRPEVAGFIDRHLGVLEAKPSAFFSVNAVARKSEKRGPDTNIYVRKFLASIAWKPQLIGIFGGKIDYPRYGFFDKHMIRFIMWMTKGPTDPTGTFEFTDWDAVHAFGKSVGDMLD
jgi:menaquinone-dependent protoporphyrinogen oxidase